MADTIEPTSSHNTASSHDGLKTSKDNQQDLLVQQLGYAPEYRRAFKSIGIIGLSLSLASPMSAIFVVAWYQAYYAGYWGFTWGWIVPCLLMFPTALASAELASSMPVNGAFYWYSGALASPKYSRVVAFIAGWVNTSALITAVASFVYALASSLVAVLALLLPDLVLSLPQQLGVAYGVTFIWAVLSFGKVEHQNWIFICTGAITLTTSLLYTIGLPAAVGAQGLGFASGSDLFGTFTNMSDWPAGVAVPFSWFSVLWSVTGWQSAAYVAEETHDASRQVPKAIMNSFYLMSGIGLVICIVTASCVTDMEAFADDITGYPVYTLLKTAWGTNLSFAFAFIVWMTVLIGGSGTMLTSSSQVAAFARDGGLPFPHIFTYIHQASNIPIWSECFLIVGTMLLLLFSLSAVASNIIYSLSVVSGLVTYSIPMALRCFAGDRWVPGPYSLGRWSIPIHAFSVAINAYFCIINCFPEAPQVDAATFNWNWVLSLVVAIIITGVWFVVRDNFQGLDLEALRTRQQEYQNVLLGIEPGRNDGDVQQVIVDGGKGTKDRALS